jgi:hypothetical protein
VESSPAGINRTPPKKLAALIAPYVFSPDGLKRRPLEPLLEALHPDPAAADKELLRAKIEELEKVAGHVAMIVRGGTVKSGHPIEEVSRWEHFLAWDIQQLDPEGTSSDEEMFDRLREWWREGMDDFTPKDIRWLRSLKLPLPELHSPSFHLKNLLQAPCVYAEMTTCASPLVGRNDLCSPCFENGNKARA